MGFGGNNEFPGVGALTTDGDPVEQEATGAIRSKGPRGEEAEDSCEEKGPKFFSTHAMLSGEAGSGLKGLFLHVVRWVRVWGECTRSEQEVGVDNDVIEEGRGTGKR